MFIFSDSSNGLTSHLLLIHNTGSVVVFGHTNENTMFLPDSVKKSEYLCNHLLTSNYTDLYNNTLTFTDTLVIDSVLLPIKGKIIF